MVNFRTHGLGFPILYLIFVMHLESTRIFIKKLCFQFCRTISAASEQPSSIRPLPVLQKTLKYLLEIAESSDHPFGIVHDFILDRTRSIRQDLGIQNIINDDVIFMYEEMVHNFL